MDLCYATDNNFCMQTAVSMLSVLAESREKSLCFHLLDAGVSDENYKILSAITTEAGVALKRYNVSPLLERVKKTGQKSWGDFPTHATWARLFLPELLPEEIDRVLYLDGDVIASGDYTTLFERALNGCPVAAVEDCVPRSHKQKIGLPANVYYVNAGVLLFDMACWRKTYDPNWPEHYLAGILRYPMADQDVINLMFQGRCVYLPLRYNYTSWYRALDLSALKRLMLDEQLCQHTRAEQIACQSEAIFIHYNTCSLVVRPWYQNATDPATEYWLKYYRQSVWESQKLQTEPVHMNRGELRDRKMYRFFGKKYFIPVHQLDLNMRHTAQKLLRKGIYR